MKQACAQLAGRRSRRRCRARRSSLSCLGARQPIPATIPCSPIHSIRVRSATASSLHNSRLVRRTCFAGVRLKHLCGQSDRPPRVGGLAARMWQRGGASLLWPAARRRRGMWPPGPQHGCAALCGNAYAMQCAFSVPHACGWDVQPLCASGSIVRARVYVILKIACRRDLGSPSS